MASSPNPLTIAHLSSRLRLLKIVVADLVLKNANLTGEVRVLRRVASQMEMATSQDLMALMRWFVKELNIPLPGQSGMTGSGSSAGYGGMQTLL